ncbi:hypothetical protein Hanom_Chr03g00201161 [Helianthus anomalus]
MRECMPRVLACTRSKIQHIVPHLPRYGRACECECSAPFASILSECFHETIRMESCHLNIPLSFISPPIWDKVPLSHIFSIKVSNTKL